MGSSKILLYATVNYMYMCTEEFLADLNLVAIKLIGLMADLTQKFSPNILS